MNGFETAVINEPPVFEPLKFYCMCHSKLTMQNPFELSSHGLVNVFIMLEEF